MKTAHKIYVPLIGRHNIENAIVAITIAMMLGYTGAAIADAFRSLPQVPGRMERISSIKGWHAFVDYAHTPDALEQSLRSLRTHYVQEDCGSCLDVGEIETVRNVHKWALLPINMRMGSGLHPTIHVRSLPYRSSMISCWTSYKMSETRSTHRRS